MLLVSGHFIAFTYVRPLLTCLSGMDASWIGALLFAHGLAGIAGNFIAGPLAARHPRGTVLAIASGLMLTPLLFLWVGNTPSAGIAVLLLWLSLHHAQVAVVSVFYNLQVLVVMLISPFLLRGQETITPALVAGTVLALLGTVMIVLG